MKKMNDQFLCSRMMLPEHRKALSQRQQKIREAEDRRIPLFDEQELELWEWFLRQSLEQGTKITVSYLSEGGEKIVSGVALKNDIPGGMIIMAGKKSRVRVEVKKILSIEGY
jgi:hypothetical protein